MKKNPVFLLVSFLVFLAGCGGTTFRTTMMPDGITWEIAVSSYGDCGGGWHSTDDCVKNIRPEIERRALETCSTMPARIFNCGTRRGDPYREVVCNIRCTDFLQVKIKNGKNIDDNAEKQIVHDGIIEKARRCQNKGGIWVNDSCQITLD